eukprot:12169215-Alexandrium_andersonii.AAC.1
MSRRPLPSFGAPQVQACAPGPPGRTLRAHQWRNAGCGRARRRHSEGQWQKPESSSPVPKGVLRGGNQQAK